MSSRSALLARTSERSRCGRCPRPPRRRRRLCPPPSPPGWAHRAAPSSPAGRESTGRASAASPPALQRSAQRTRCSRGVCPCPELEPEPHSVPYLSPDACDGASGGRGGRARDDQARDGRAVAALPARLQQGGRLAVPLAARAGQDERLRSALAPRRVARRRRLRQAQRRRAVRAAAIGPACGNAQPRPHRAA